MTWCHYLKGCKYEDFILINHNNLHCFIDTKSLNSRQVYWAQELAQYHFKIGYHQDKTNAAINILSHFSQKSQAKEEIFRVKNSQIFHYL